MIDLRKLFVREARTRGAIATDPDSDYHPSDRRGEGLEVEYQTLIATQFRRWGISPHSVTIEVRRIGQAPDGYDVLVGMVRLAHWDRSSGLRLLVGLPLLEAKVRKMVRGTWLADFSHFGGLWLHTSERLQSEGAHGDLRELLMQLVPPAPPSPGSGAQQSSSGYGSTTVPPQSSEMSTGTAGLSQAGEQEPVSG